MMFIRPIEKQDTQTLLQMAEVTGTGFTSLPHDEKHITNRIDRMLATQQGTAPLCDQGYLFVLEDSETGEMVGVSAIEVAIGLGDPWYTFHIGTQVHASKDLGIYRKMKKLSLSNDHTGHSELCTLFLNPDYRKNKNGHLLSKCRFLFIAAFKELFSNKLFAEMRGYTDEQGNSPLWEGLGKHFFNLSFDEVDYQTGIGNKSFIAELMPKHAIYIDFLSEAAQQVIGEVHTNTIPARKILESEGLRHEGYVDIFDGGPTLEAYTDDLRIVRKSELRRVSIVANESSDTLSPGKQTLLIGNEQYLTFRAIIGEPAIDDEYIYLTSEQADVLNVSNQDSIRVVPLFEKEKEL
ncbi:arginine N-succinyltransferase [Vibrio sp. WJH972]